MKGFLAYGVLGCLMQGIASKPLEVVKNTIDLTPRLHSSPNIESMSGTHNAHNMIGGTPHKVHLQDMKSILSGDHKLSTKNRVYKGNLHYNNAEEIYLYNPPSPSSLHGLPSVLNGSRQSLDRSPRRSPKMHDDLYFSAGEWRLSHSRW